MSSWAISRSVLLLLLLRLEESRDSDRRRDRWVRQNREKREDRSVAAAD